MYVHGGVHGQRQQGHDGLAQRAATIVGGVKVLVQRRAKAPRPGCVRARHGRVRDEAVARRLTLENDGTKARQIAQVMNQGKGGGFHIGVH